MKIKNLRTWKTMLLFGILTLGLNACSDDDTEQPKENNGKEKESAWLQNMTVNTPGGAVRYIQITEQRPTSIDVSQSVELGVGTDIEIFEEFIYAINYTASTITKWSVDRVSLEFKVEGILSYASSGIDPNNTGSSMVFLTKNQAFLSDLKEGVVVEWNPEKMEITKIHNVDSAVENVAGNLGMYQGKGFALSEKVGWTVQYSIDNCCENLFPQGGATIGIFDPNTGTISYKRDNRLLQAGWGIQDQNGNRFVQPDRDNGFYDNYFNIDNAVYGSPFVLLKMDDNGNFDPSFEFDYAEVIPNFTHGGIISLVYDNKLVITYDEVVWPDNFDDAWNWWGDTSISRTVSIDIETKEVKPYTALEGYGDITYTGTIDGANYYSAYTWDNDLNFWVTDILQQNAVDDFTVVTTFKEGALILSKLW